MEAKRIMFRRGQMCTWKIATAAFFATLTVLFVTNCEDKTAGTTVSPGVSDTQVVFGCSAALGGHASFLGTQYVHGSLAYINEINERGGVHGRQIKLITYDDEYDPPETMANTQRLINRDGVFALFDYVGTPTSVKIIDIVHQAKIPALGFFTGAEALRTPFRPYMFHIRDSYYSEAEAAVGYFVDRLGLKKIAVVYQEDAFGLAVLTGAQLALKRRNMETCVTETFQRGTLDVEKALRVVKANKAEAVIMVGTYTPLAKFVQLALEADFSPYFYTVSFVGSKAFGRELVEKRKIAREFFDRIIVTQVVPSPFDVELPAVRKYQALTHKYYPHDRPNYVALEGFVNAVVLVEALKAAGRDLSRERFLQALESMHNVDVGIGIDVTYTVLDHQGIEGVYFSKLTSDGTFRIFDPLTEVSG
jgi:branched-chain amino acid transport system substrate-binding protein